MHDQTKATIPTIIVVFGATGDLIQKKIAPSLYNLFEAGRLPQFFKIVGVSRRDLNNQGFRDHIKDILKKRKILERNPMVKKYLACLSYVQGDFTKIDTYIDLAEKLQKIDDQKKICTNKLFYLAVPPKYYDVIFKNFMSLLCAFLNHLLINFYSCKFFNDFLILELISIKKKYYIIKNFYI